MNKLDLAWLAGIVDGEGNIQIVKKKANNGKYYLCAKVRISNCDIRMIKKISEIYKSLNLVFFFSLMNKNNPKWKTGLNIEIASQGTTLKLLKLIYPYLINKKRLAEILMDMLLFLRTFPKGGNTTSYNYFETEEMKEYYKQYEIERKWYFEPSTTTRKANSVIEFDAAAQGLMI